MLRVRLAMAEDAEGIGDAHAEAWRVAYAGLFSDHVLTEAIAVRRSMWPIIFNDAEFGRSTLLVAESDDVGVVGFIHFGTARTDPECAEIYGFYLHPRAWGGGAATMLMEAALDHLRQREFQRVVLWTHEGAGRARRFYERSGWRASGRREEQAIASPEEPTTVVEYTRNLHT